MTHAEKLQQIFDAALRDSSDHVKPLARAFPASLGMTAVAVSQPAAEPECAPGPVVTATPTANAGLSHTVAAKTAGLLEEQQERESPVRRRAAWASLAVVLVLFGGVSGWFIQSTQRVPALSGALNEVRSADDAAFSSVQKATRASSNQVGAMDAEMLAMTGESAP